MPHQKTDLVFYYNPHSRAASVLPLFEELGIEFELKLINFKTRDEYKEEFVKINPMSKIPTVVHKGVVVTEQPAIYTYLADEFSYGKLAPKIGSSTRGSYLRWMSFYGSSFEPALIDISLKRDAAQPMQSPYGNAELVLKTLNNHLESHTYMTGDDFTAVDVLWGAGLAWVTLFGLVQRTQPIDAYIKRVTERPSFVEAEKKSHVFAKELGLE